MGWARGERAIRGEEKVRRLKKEKWARAVILIRLQIDTRRRPFTKRFPGRSGKGTRPGPGSGKFSFLGLSLSCVPPSLFRPSLPERERELTEEGNGFIYSIFSLKDLSTLERTGTCRASKSSLSPIMGKKKSKNRASERKRGRRRRRQQKYGTALSLSRIKASASSSGGPNYLAWRQQHACDIVVIHFYPPFMPMHAHGGGGNERNAVSQEKKDIFPPLSLSGCEAAATTVGFRERDKKGSTKIFSPRKKDPFFVPPWKRPVGEFALCRVCVHTHTRRRLIISNTASLSPSRTRNGRKCIASTCV